MRYAEPESVEAALSALSTHEDALCLAGGASLVAMMNAGRIAPGMLVSLHRIPELFRITETGDGVWLGAMCTHRTVAADTRLRGAMEVVRAAARQLAHPAIRNMATLGGSIGLADPQTELPVALVAASALAEVASANGRRVVPVESLFVDSHRTSLQRGELVTRVFLPQGAEGAVGHHLRYSRVAADYPTVSLSLVLDMDGDTCRQVRIVLGSCGPVPLHVDAADQRLVGTRLEAEDVADAGGLLAQAAAPIDDVRGSAEYRRMLIPRLLGRALSQARERAHV
ncbi:FAD binding domain-containing protein [Myxococcus sp. Y35]|uniref:FAD binding domain-containing protein n=1 Tax=Pseudomyxococcus flavus TaxID=3115648 RepID=UPI003CE6F434